MKDKLSIAMFAAIAGYLFHIITTNPEPGVIPIVLFVLLTMCSVGLSIVGDGKSKG